eukprot:scaffold7259_cov77-Skeletonema_dohrnii-CCMP3373.AAC.1
MENREYHYYEEQAASIKLEEITSSENNAMILRRLRDGDDKLRHLSLGSQGWSKFHIGEGNDLGWLGYFIGKSVKLYSLDIWDFPVYEGVEQQIHAFMDGIARNQSIRKIITSSLGDYDGSTAIVRALGSWTQLEELVYACNNGPTGCSALGTLLELGVLKLRQLRIASNDIGDDGVASLANGLRSIGSSLKEICLSENSIGNEGLLTLMSGLGDTAWLELPLAQRRSKASVNTFYSIRCFTRSMKRRCLGVREIAGLRRYRPHVAAVAGEWGRPI